MTHDHKPSAVEETVHSQSALVFLAVRLPLALC